MTRHSRAVREGMTHIRNSIMYSPLGQRFYFVPRAAVLGNGVCRVVGKKYDVTDSIAQYVKARFLTAPAAPKGRKR
jgi:hypothetical protein